MLASTVALHALEHHVHRLADDHANARRLADGLTGIAEVRVRAPETNMVFLDLDEERPGLVERLAAAGVLCPGVYEQRLVTHLDVTADDVDAAVAALRASR